MSKLAAHRRARSALAPVILARSGWSGSARPGPSSSSRRGGIAGAAAEHRGLHRHRQGSRRGQARPGRDRPGGLRLLRADRRRDRQVPRRQAADPRRVRRAQARQRRRRRARAAGRPEGQMQNPYFFDYQPNTRTKTEVQLSRKLVVKAADIRKMDEESVLQLVGRLLDVAQDAGGQGRSAATISILIITIDAESSPTTGLVRFVARGFRQAPGGSLREGDRRRADPGRAAGPAEQGRARADRRGPRDRRARRPALPECRRRAAAQAAGDGEVPGDPGPRGAAGAFRGSSQGRRQREDAQP